MKKNLTSRCLAILLIAGLCTVKAMAGKAKKEVYIPMDYSACGYHASEIAIPDVRNAVFVGSDGPTATRNCSAPSTTCRH